MQRKRSCKVCFDIANLHIVDSRSHKPVSSGHVSVVAGSTAAIFEAPRPRPGVFRVEIVVSEENVQPSRGRERMKHRAPVAEFVGVLDVS